MIHISSQFLYVFHLFLLSSSFPSYLFLLLLSIQAVPFEINLGKNKWLVISVYRPPNQNSQCFLNELDKTIDCFSVSCDIHVLVIGDFNLEPSTGLLKHSNALYNWIKMNTCFKGKRTWIDLILTNRKYSFKDTNTFETKLSDHHHMIYTILKAYVRYFLKT